VARWAGRGFRIVAPLHDVRDGSIVNVQARRIVDTQPKTMSPKGSVVAGTCFANAEGVRLLRAEQTERRPVLVCEGLTDTLAACAAVGDEFPVLGTTGVGNASRCVSTWAIDAVVFVATDLDEAGERVVRDVADAAYEHGAKDVRRLLWPEPAGDACDALRLLGAEALAEFLERVVVDDAEDSR
ncbi:MAG: toprim domain-containing protein, partial [Planctomycetota bacterium JB042]